MANKKEFDPTNTAAIWGNPKQLENEKRPILRGMLNVEGTDYKVSLWANGFFTEDEGLQSDIEAVLAELLELIEEAGGKAPIMRGKIEPAEESGAKKQPGSRRTSGGRSERAKPARTHRTKPAAAEAGDDEAW